MALTWRSVKKVLENRWLLIVLRLAIGAVFITASWDKVLNPHRFAQIIQGYDIVSGYPVWAMAVWLPWVELGVGLMLVAGIWVRAAALLFSGLTIVFIVAIASAIVRGLDIQCGCFSLSPAAEARTWASLGQEVALLIGCLWLWVGHWPTAPAQSSASNSPQAN